jgi:hypothetical protein
LMGVVAVRLQHRSVTANSVSARCRALADMLGKCVGVAKRDSLSTRGPVLARVRALADPEPVPDVALVAETRWHVTVTESACGR